MPYAFPVHAPHPPPDHELHDPILLSKNLAVLFRGLGALKIVSGARGYVSLKLPAVRIYRYQETASTYGAAVE